MKFAQFCKGVSICIFILAFLGSFAIAKKYSTTVTITEYEVFADRVEKDTDSGKYAIILITTWISSGILCIFLYGLGEIVESLDYTNKHIVEIEVKQHKIKGLLDEYTKNTPGE